MTFASIILLVACGSNNVESTQLAPEAPPSAPPLVEPLHSTPGSADKFVPNRIIEVVELKSEAKAMYEGSDEEFAKELEKHLFWCANNASIFFFNDSALPFFVKYPDQSIPPLIAFVEQHPGMAARAAKALGVLRAQAAVPALAGSLMRDSGLHQQSEAARALWLIGTDDAIEALRAAIVGGGDPARRALNALKPLEGRDPCALVAVGQRSGDEDLQWYVSRAAERCGCEAPGDQ